VRIIADENLPPAWASYLSEAGHDARHWRDVGSIGDSDEIVFRKATCEKALILTQDLDFSRILAAKGTDLPSVIQLRVSIPIPDLVGPSVLSVLDVHRESLVTGCLISLSQAEHRVRLLPL